MNAYKHEGYSVREDHDGKNSVHIVYGILIFFPSMISVISIPTQCWFLRNGYPRVLMSYLYYISSTRDPRNSSLPTPVEYIVSG